jgi:hypothetical protein
MLDREGSASKHHWSQQLGLAGPLPTAGYTGDAALAHHTLARHTAVHRGALRRRSLKPCWPPFDGGSLAGQAALACFCVVPPPSPELRGAPQGVGKARGLPLCSVEDTELKTLMPPSTRPCAAGSARLFCWAAHPPGTCLHRPLRHRLRACLQVPLVVC